LNGYKTQNFLLVKFALLSRPHSQGGKPPVADSDKFWKGGGTMYQPVVIYPKCIRRSIRLLYG